MHLIASEALARFVAERHYSWLESYMEWLEGKEERAHYHARSLRRNSPALGDEPPIAPMRAFWLWEGSASFLCHPPALWVRPLGS
jgi:hypothetical protein